MKLSSFKGLLVVALCLLVAVPNDVSAKKKKKADANQTVAKDSLQNSYAKFTKKSKKKTGIFTIHEANKKFYLEIPNSLLNKDLMMSSKISATSDAKIISAGEMLDTPQLVCFTRSNDNILLKSTDLRVDVIQGQEGESKSIHKNYMDPTLESFKIVEKSPNDSSYVIDVTSFMLSTSGSMGVKAGVMVPYGRGPKLTPNTSMNEVIDAKAFEKNVNFKCRLVYKISETPFEATVTRSIIILPEKPMKGRIGDVKMNYFRTRRMSFDSNNSQSKLYEYINRWNLQPKPEDLEAYKAGKLVVPAKQIVYYVDDAFPEKLRKYVKQGIEDWQIAFEKIGFKDAIIAKDFPKDDPNFNCKKIVIS